MKKGLKSYIGVALAGFLFTTASGMARAETRFPSQPIKFIVPFSPGTGSDAIARIMADAMTEPMGQSVIVENRGGAGGITGTKSGAMAAPNGYTLTVGTTSTLITNPILNPLAQYDVAKDFIPVAGLGRAYYIVGTANTPDAPKTLAELINRLKDGKGTYASSGVGTITHLASEALLNRAGVKATHVPYKGSSAAISDTAAGHVLFASDTLAASLPMVQGGKFRPLAVTSPKRIASLPDVPTVAESGFPGFYVDAWWGLMAPTGTPPAIVNRIADAALEAMQKDSVKKRFAALELEPLPLRSEQLQGLIAEQTPFWADFIKKANIKLD